MHIPLRHFRLLLPLLGMSLAFGARAQSPACAPEGVSLVRGTFASAIEDREPAEVPERAGGADIFYFTQIAGARDQQLLHRWQLDGEPLAAVRLTIGSDRWRTWSQVRGADLRPGRLVVSAELPEGCVLDSREIAVSKPVSVSADEAAADPADAPPAAAPMADAPAGEAAPSDAQTAADAPKAQQEPDPAEAARRAASAEALQRQATAHEEAGRFAEAAAALAQAIELLPAEETAGLRDRLYYHLPLAQARQAMREKNAEALRATLAPIRGYLRDHPKRFEYSRTVDNYYKALFMLESGH